MDGRRLQSHSRLWVRAPRRSTALAACVVYGESAQPHEPRFYIVYKSFMEWRARAGPLRHVAGAPRGTPPCIRKPTQAQAQIAACCEDVARSLTLSSKVRVQLQAARPGAASQEVTAQPHGQHPHLPLINLAEPGAQSGSRGKAAFVAPPPSCTPPL